MVGINHSVAVWIGEFSPGENSRKIIGPLQAARDDQIIRPGSTHGVEHGLHADRLICLRGSHFIAVIGCVLDQATMQPDIP